VPGIRKQGDGMRRQAIDHLDYDKTKIERGRKSERRAKMLGCVRMMGVVVGHALDIEATAPVTQSQALCRDGSAFLRLGRQRHVQQIASSH
jgi:hypothetical protein